MSYTYSPRYGFDGKSPIGKTDNGHFYPLAFRDGGALFDDFVLGQTDATKTISGRRLVLQAPVSFSVSRTCSFKFQPSFKGGSIAYSLRLTADPPEAGTARGGSVYVVQHSLNPFSDNLTSGTITISGSTIAHGSMPYLFYRGEIIFYLSTNCPAFFLCDFN